MESTRQMMSAIYCALASTMGEGALEGANRIIEDAIDTGAVDDPYARSALAALVRSCKEMERA
jgi:hypothetical protein